MRKERMVRSRNNHEQRRKKPAEKNPWYVLATIYGEQGALFDEELHAKNRRIWNGGPVGIYQRRRGKS
jgi:hypothetical protein